MSSCSCLLFEAKLVFSYFGEKAHDRIFLGLCGRRFDVGLPRAGENDLNYLAAFGVNYLASWEVIEVRPDMTPILDNDDAHAEELESLRAWSFLDQR